MTEDEYMTVKSFHIEPQEDPYEPIRVVEAGGREIACFDLDDAPVHDYNARQWKVAHLVKSAPDLLSAAKAVMAWWDEHEYDTHSIEGEEYNVFDEEPDFVAAARMAIARARGGV